MKKEKKLLLARNIFVFIIFVSFGVIIVTEKGKDILIPKVEKEMQEYLVEKYPDIKDQVEMSEVTLNNNTYQMTISSKENKELNFKIKKSHRKITDTYKKDYLEGSSLLTNLQKELQDNIRKQTSTEADITIISTLDQFTDAVRDRIIKEDNLLELKFYTIKKEIMIADWNKENITKSIIKDINLFENKGITPKNYIFIITNQKDITESIEITNITSSFKEESRNIEMVQDILDDHQSKLLKENKITFKYLN